MITNEGDGGTKATAVRCRRWWHTNNNSMNVDWQSMNNGGYYWMEEKSEEEERKNMERMERRGAAIMKILPRQMATLTTFFMPYIVLLCRALLQAAKRATNVYTNMRAQVEMNIIIMIICREYERDAHAHTNAYAWGRRKNADRRDTRSQ